MSALVTHVWTVELAPTEWMGSPAAVYRDLEEHGVKQVSVCMSEYFFERLHALHPAILMVFNIH